MSKIESRGYEVAGLQSLSNSQVKVDSAGNIQCYIYCNELDDIEEETIKANCRRFEVTDRKNKIVQGWFSVSSIELLKEYDFIYRIHPPDYARTH